MAKRRKKRGSKKTLHVRGAIVHISGAHKKKRRKKAAKKVVDDVAKNMAASMKRGIKKVEKVLKYPFKAGKGHQFGLKMKIRGRKKFGHTDHRSAFSD